MIAPPHHRFDRRSARAGVALVMLAACGRVGFDADAGADAGRDAAPPSIDAGPRDAGAEDAAFDGGSDAGLVLPIFSEPTAIAELASRSTDQDPSLTEDELEIFFVSARDGEVQIWWSSRADIAAPWDPPSLRTELASPLAESDPEVSADGLHLYFSRQSDGADSDVDVYEASRASRDAPWTAIVRVAALSSDLSECCAIEEASGDRIVFSRIVAIGTADLVRATRGPTGWTNVVPIAELRTDATEANPFLTAGDLAIFFDSDRPGLGARDIYFATRPDLESPFSDPMRVETVSSPVDDRDVWVSSDGERVYFAREVPRGLEIVLATRAR
jgi:hypothetical protein